MVPEDIYTEAEGDPDTLSNLGPLSSMAGIWQGSRGDDSHPVAEGTERDAFVERYEAQPTDRQNVVRNFSTDCAPTRLLCHSPSSPMWSTKETN